ncbi:hypothetical protein ACVWXN_009752 [Bradyrhizobium sp. i1.4.4]
MHQAASLQFERVMDELVLWHAVPEDERSPAPAWWSGTGDGGGRRARADATGLVL